MGETTYQEPTPAWVAGVMEAGGDDVDPSMFFQKGWTKKQRDDFASKFRESARRVKQAAKDNEYLVPKLPDKEPSQEDLREFKATRGGHALRDAIPVPGLRDVGAGAAQGLGDIASVVLRGAEYATEATGITQRHESEDMLADRLNRQMEEAEIAAQRAGRESTPDLELPGGYDVNFGSVVRGAARSGTTAYTLGGAGLGAKAIIGGFGLSRANQAITEANDAGLDGPERYLYIGAAGAIEAGIAGAFQAMPGRGGLESMITGTGQVSREGVKGFFKDLGWELVEENLTEVLDAVNQQLFDVGPQMTMGEFLLNLPNILIQTTLQTGLLTGGAGVYTYTGQKEQRESLVTGLVESGGFTQEQAEGIVKRAARRKGPFLENFGREYQVEKLRLSPEALGVWAAENYETAKKLSEKDYPSRRDFEDANLPPRSGKIRHQIAQDLKAILEDVPPPGGQQEEGAPPREISRQEHDALVEGRGNFNVRPFGTGHVTLEQALGAQAAREGKIEGLDQFETVQQPALTQGEQSELAQLEGELDDHLKSKGRKPNFPTGRKELMQALSKGEVAPEDYAEAARQRRKNELDAVEPDSNDFRSMDADTLAAKLHEFKDDPTIRAAAEERLTILRNPVPKETDWKKANEDDLRALIWAKAVHPDERQEAIDRLVKLAKPRIEERRKQEAIDNRKKSVEKLRGFLEPFLEAWEDGERDPEVLTKGWPKGAENADKMDFFSADMALEEGIIDQEQYDAIQVGFEARKELLAERREEQKKKKADRAELRARRHAAAVRKAFWFESGYSRSPRDMQLAIEEGIPIGVAAYKKGRGSPLIEQIVATAADYANNGGKVFVDSGAFSDFMEGVKEGGKPKPTDWKRVMSTYARIFARVDEVHRQNIYVVAPDVVGNDEATQKLQANFYKTINEWEDAGLSVIIPIQKGGESLSTSWADTTDNLKRAEEAVVGIPYNKEAWHKKDVVKFIKEQAKSRGTAAHPLRLRIHLLGGGESKVKALLKAVEKAKIDNLLLSLSGDSRNKAASRRQRDGKAKVEAEDQAAAAERQPLPESPYAMFKHVEDMDDQELGDWLRPYVTGKGRGEFVRQIRRFGPGVASTGSFEKNLETLKAWRDRSVGAYEAMAELYKELPNLQPMYLDKPGKNEVAEFLAENDIHLPPQIAAMVQAGAQPVETRLEWLKKFMVEQMSLEDFARLTGEEVTEAEAKADEADRKRRKETKARIKANRDRLVEEGKPARAEADRREAPLAAKNVKEQDFKPYSRRAGWVWRKRTKGGSETAVYRHEASGDFVVKRYYSDFAYAVVNADLSMDEDYGAGTLDDAFAMVEDKHQEQLAELNEEAEVQESQELANMRRELQGQTVAAVRRAYGAMELQDMALKAGLSTLGNKDDTIKLLLAWAKGEAIEAAAQAAADDARRRNARSKAKVAGEDQGFLKKISKALKQEEQDELAQLEAELGDHVRDNLFSPGLDPVLINKGGRITYLYAKAGILTFREYAKRMLSKFGLKVGPHLKPLWDRVASEHDDVGEKMDEPSRSEAKAILAEVADELGLSVVDDNDEDALDHSEMEDELWALVESDEHPATKKKSLKELAKKYGITDKEAQERYESTLVEYARQIANDSVDTERERFDTMVELLAGQIVLDEQTSTSKMNQAVSTPLPLAFAASLMAQVDEGTSLYEPTAGTGMLTMLADPADTVVNELGDLRNQLLKEKGYKAVHKENAALFQPEGKFDRVLANPPFGELLARHTDPNVSPKLGNEPKSRKHNGHVFTKLEHYVSVRALDAMKDDGVGVVIVGAESEIGKADGGLSKSNRIFLEYLHRNFHVVGDYKVAGKLYRKQGAGWPLRMVVVTQRRPDMLPEYKVNQEDTTRIESWDQLWSEVENVRDGIAAVRAGLDAEGRRGSVDAGPEGDAGTADAEGGAESAAPASGKAGRGGKRGGTKKGRRGSGRKPTRGQRPGRDADVEGRADAEDAAGRDPGGVAQDVEGTTGESDQDAAASDEQSRGEPGDSRPDAGDLGASSPVVEVKEGKRVGLLHVEYSTASANPFRIGTIVARMLAPGMVNALNELQSRVGNVDDYVMDKLGYKTKAELYKALAAEQIDSVALAIYNIENSKSLIIGDQTGIGKGRQAAAMIAYAKRMGYMPVFLTVKPKLFSDIYKDTENIGKTVKPLIFGEPNNSTIRDEDNKVVLKAKSTLMQKRAAEAHLAGKKKIRDAGYDAVFMPYSQLSALEDMTKASKKKRKNKGKLASGKRDLNFRQQLLNDLVTNDKVLFVMDESHNAAGDSIIGNYMRGGTVRQKIKGEKEIMDFSPGAMNQPGVMGVAYLSATYAKNPETMALYFKTALGLATKEAGKLLEAFKKGGVALQQWSANALALGGEMVRRERDYTGVRVDTVKIAESDEDKAKAIAEQDAIADSLRSINLYARAAAEAINEMELEDTAKTEQRMTGSEFASVMHNYVAQILLASKVDAAVAQAVASKEKGEQTVIVLTNTMESFLEKFAKENGLEVGDALDLDFGDVLKMALDKTMSYKHDLGGGETEVRTFTARELGLQDYYDSVLAKIRSSAGETNLAVSPIDMLHRKMQDAGLVTAELTGRTMKVDYDEFGSGSLEVRSKDEKADQNRIINAFQAAETDALIINAAGATGISLHAQDSNPKPRHMIVAQPSLNIDLVMQALGRILRTGMPGAAKDFARYSFLSSPVQAERRPFAILNAKLASLNANTTADAEGSVKVKSLNFINKLGDKVVAEVLHEDKDLAAALFVSEKIKVSKFGVVSGDPDLARTATGRLAVMPDAVQEAFYEEVTSRYEELVRMHKEAGTYDLEVEVQETWDAKKQEQELVLEDAIDPSQPFTSGLKLTRWSIVDPNVPMDPNEVRAAMDRGLGISELSEQPRVVSERIQEFYKAADEAAKEWVGEEPEALEDDATEDEKKAYSAAKRQYDSRKAAVEAGRTTIKAQLDDVLEVAGSYTEIKYQSDKDQPAAVYYGALTNVRLSIPDKEGNPWVPGRLQVQFAVESSRRTVTIPVSKLASTEYSIRPKLMPNPWTLDQFARRFVKGERTNRFMFTGNMIAAMATAKRGSITTFRTSDGEAVTALVMPPHWKPSQIKDDPRLAIETWEALDRLVKPGTYGKAFEARGFNQDGKRPEGLSISYTYGGWRLSVSTKGGRSIYADPEVVKATGDWKRYGKVWEVTVEGRGKQRAWDALTELGYTFKAHNATPQEVMAAHGKDVSDVQFSPGRGAPRQPVTPTIPSITPRKEGGIQKVEVIKLMEREWPELKVRAAGWFRRSLDRVGGGGMYRASLAEVRTRIDNDVLEALHELGHHLDRELGHWSKSHGKPAGVRDDLIKLGKRAYPGGVPGGGSFQAEGFAEFIRDFILNDPKLQQRAQDLYAWFTSRYLARNPELARKIKLLEDAINFLYTQDHLAEGEAFMRAPRRSFDGGRIAAAKAAFVKRMVDANIPLLYGMQDTGYDLSQIPPDKHPYLLATFFSRSSSGRARHAALSASVDLYGQELQDGKSLKEILGPIMAKGEEWYRDWKMFAAAKRAQYRYHPNNLESGLSPEAADKIVDEFKDRDGYEKALFEFTRFAHQQLHLLVQAGMMTQDEYSRIVQANQIYVPFMRRVEVGENRPGQGEPGAGPAINRVTGNTNLPIHDPVEAMLLQTEKLHQSAMHHKILTSLVEFYDEAGQGGARGLGKFMAEEPQPKRTVRFGAEQIRTQLMSFVNDNVADQDTVDSITDSLMDFWDEKLSVQERTKDRSRKPVLTIRTVDDKGRQKLRTFTVQPDLIPILESVGGQGALKGFAGKAFRNVTSLQRLGATGLNPGFGLIRNTVRDMLTASVMADYHVHVPIVSTAAGLKEAWSDEKYARLYHGSGLDISGRLGHDLASLGLARGGEAMGNAKYVAKQMTMSKKRQIVSVAAWRDALSFSEIAPRILEYKAAYEQAEAEWGTPEAAAVLAGCAAKDVTVNFSRAGTWGKGLNELVLFFNAGVQSLDKALRAYGITNPAPWQKNQDRKANALRSFRRSSALTAFALALYFMFHRDDDEWKKLPAHEKWGFLHVPAGSSTLRIPLPFEVGAVFGAWPVAMLEGPEAFKEAVDVATKNAAPLDLDGLHGIARNFTMLAPITDVLANRDWKGAPIVPESVQHNALEQDWHGVHTTWLAKEVGSLTGGSPAQIEHAVENYTGGLYRRMATMLGLIGDVAQGDSGIDSDPGTWPVINTLFLRPNTSRVVGDFYERLRHLRQLRGSWKRGTAEMTLAEMGELTLAERVSDDLQDVWKRRRETATSAPTKAERREAAGKLLGEAQELIEQTYMERNKKLDRQVGIGSVAYKVSAPSADKDDPLWNALRDVPRDDAFEALRVHAQRMADMEARRKGRKFAPPVQAMKNGKLTGYGRRRAKIAARYNEGL